MVFAQMENVFFILVFQILNQAQIAYVNQCYLIAAERVMNVVYHKDLNGKKNNEGCN